MAVRDRAGYPERLARGHSGQVGAQMDVPTIDQDPVAAALARCPLFAGLGHDDLIGLAREMRTRRFRRGEVLRWGGFGNRHGPRV